MALTAKQRAFVAAYAGNGTEAARLAGYTGNDATLTQVAHENLRKPEVAEAIKVRETTRTDKLIATRADRQRFWSEVFRSENSSMSDRLRASELLGKSEADFTEKHEHSGGVSIQVINPYAVEPGDE